jgi:hypothetical protein
MAIKVLSHESRTIPVMFCDICEKQINKDDHAEYLIPRVKDGEFGDIIVGHTACTQPFEKKAFKSNRSSYGNMSLGHLLFCLVHNQGIDLEKEQKRSEELERLGI